MSERTWVTFVQMYFKEVILYTFQGAVALYNAGVSKERFGRFVDYYTEQLERAEGPTRKKQDENVDLMSLSVEELKGEYCAHASDREEEMTQQRDSSVNFVLPN